MKILDKNNNFENILSKAETAENVLF